MIRYALAVLIVLALAGCYGLPPATESAVRDAIAVDRGHADDESLPTPAREIAMDNHDVLWQILYGAGCVDDLPEDVRARMDARK